MEEMDAVEATWPRSLLREFRIQRLIGKGSYSTVWEAVHRQTGKMVAIKREDDVLENIEDAKYMLREIRLLQALKHDNIIRLYDLRAPKTSGLTTLFLILELASTDLKSLIKSGSVFLTAQMVQGILYNILRGLKYIDSAGVLHRDLKPANILLTESFAPKICDFGLARSIVQLTGPVAYLKKSKEARERLNGIELPDEDEDPMADLEEDKQKPFPLPSLGLTKQLTGYVETRWYRAPEVILVGNEYGPAIDIWAVGCIFAELLSLQKGNLQFGNDRSVLFKGESCYPYSPARGGDKVQGGVSMLPTDQLNVILETLGTPSEADCEFIKDPEKLAVLHDLRPKPRKSLASKYPAASKDAIDLLTRMLVFNPYQRITVDMSLQHPYFKDLKDKTALPVLAPAPLTLSFEAEGPLTATRLTELFREDLARFNQLRKDGHITYS